MRLCLLLGLLLLLGACKTMQPVAHDDLSRLQGQVERGDRVEVVTTDGRTLQFTVTEVTADALVGDDVRVAQPEIATLRVKAVNKPRTFGAAFGGAGALVLILLGIALGGLMGGS
jgi:hypothetical protein